MEAMNAKSDPGEEEMTLQIQTYTWTIPMTIATKITTIAIMIRISIR